MRKKRKKLTGDAKIHIENEEMRGSDVSNGEVSEMVDGEDGVERMGFVHEIEEDGDTIRNVMRSEISQNEELVVRRAVDDQHDRTTKRLANRFVHSFIQFIHWIHWIHWIHSIHSLDSLDSLDSFNSLDSLDSLDSFNSFISFNSIQFIQFNSFNSFNSQTNKPREHTHDSGT